MELTREDLSWIYNVWVGNTFLIFGGIAAPPRNYSEQGLEERLISVKNYQSRWYLNNTLSGLDGLAATAGFLLLSIYLSGIYTPGRGILQYATGGSATYGRHFLFLANSAFCNSSAVMASLVHSMWKRW